MRFNQIIDDNPECIAIVFQGYDVPHSEVIKLHDWCAENCKDLFDIFEYDLVNMTTKGLIIYLISHDDAAAFKLRWI